MASHMYMPSSFSSNQFSTAAPPKVKREGFEIPRLSSSSNNDSSNVGGGGGGGSHNNGYDQGRLPGLAGSLSDDLWAASLNALPTPPSPPSNTSNSASAFAHLHKYTNPFPSASSSTSVGARFNPNASLEFHEALSSLVSGSALDVYGGDSGHGTLNLGGGNNSNSQLQTLERSRANSSKPNYGYSAPPATNNFSLGGSGSPFSYQHGDAGQDKKATTDRKSSVSSQHRNPSPHGHLLSNHSLGGSGGSFSPHLSNRSNRITDSPPSADSSGITAASHQSSAFSFFGDSTANANNPTTTNFHHIQGGSGGSSAFPQQSTSPLLSPATSVSFSTTPGFSAASSGGVPASSVRSRSHSAIRTGSSRGASAGGKVPSSISSRANRRGEASPTSYNLPLLSGSLGSPNGVGGGSSSSISSGGLGLLSGSAGGVGGGGGGGGGGTSGSGSQPYPLRRASTVAVPSTASISELEAHQHSMSTHHHAFSPASSNNGWMFSPTSGGGGGGERELPIVEGKETIFRQQHPTTMATAATATGRARASSMSGSGAKARRGSKGVSDAGDGMDPEERAALLNEKRRRRRESHNAVERRRRDTINEKISELATLLPSCLLESVLPGATNVTESGLAAPRTPLSTTLVALGAELGVEMIPSGGANGGLGGMLDEEDEEDEEQQQEEEAAAGAGGKKKGAKKKGKSGGAGGNNAIGPDGKPNKGIVLKKSVDYIRYLHEIIQAQSHRTSQLEASLSTLMAHQQHTQLQQQHQHGHGGAGSSSGDSGDSPPTDFVVHHVQQSQDIGSGSTDFGGSGGQHHDASATNQFNPSSFLFADFPSHTIQQQQDPQQHQQQQTRSSIGDKGSSNISGNSPQTSDDGSTSTRNTMDGQQQQLTHQRALSRSRSPGGSTGRGRKASRGRQPPSMLFQAWPGATSDDENEDSSLAAVVKQQRSGSRNSSTSRSVLDDFRQERGRTRSRDQVIPINQHQQQHQLWTATGGPLLQNGNGHHHHSGHSSHSNGLAHDVPWPAGLGLFGHGGSGGDDDDVDGVSSSPAHGAGANDVVGGGDMDARMDDGEEVAALVLAAGIGSSGRSSVSMGGGGGAVDLEGLSRSSRGDSMSRGDEGLDRMME